MSAIANGCDSDDGSFLPLPIFIDPRNDGFVRGHIWKFLENHSTTFDLERPGIRGPRSFDGITAI